MVFCWSIITYSKSFFLQFYLWLCEVHLCCSVKDLLVPVGVKQSYTNILYQIPPQGLHPSKKQYCTK